MAISRNYILEVGDQQSLENYLSAFPRKTGLIARRYGINPRMLNRYLQGAPMTGLTFNRLQLLLSDIQRDPSGMLDVR